MPRLLQITFLSATLLFLSLFFAAPALYSLWQKHNPFYGKWEGIITYYNGSQYQRTLGEAISRWESVGLPVRFLEVSSPKGADLVIYSNEEDLRKRCPTCSGYASIGDNLFRQARIDLLPPNNRFEEEIVDFSRVGTVIHELGHTLGLPHSDQPCSLMNVASLCSRLDRVYRDPEGPRIFCGPWGSDLQALGDLYGFRAKVISPSCQHKTAREQLLFRRSQTMFSPLTAGISYLDRALATQKARRKASYISSSISYLRRALARAKSRSEREYLRRSITSLEAIRVKFSSAG